ncbi:isochorismatase family protein [Streptomyces sp. IBSBF 3136]|uniref:isochorismatase family protein n=1 Tax=Streptomyces sp. IBSBF 3136 TaxID=2903524 RepID=UPI002FDC2C4C
MGGVGDQVDGGFVAGDEQQDGGGHQVRRGHAAAGAGVGGEGAEDAGAGVAAFGVDQVGQVGAHFLACLLLIEATARFAMELGFHVTLVTDATAALSPEMMHATHELNGSTYAQAIVTTEQLIAALGMPAPLGPTGPGGEVSRH